MAEVLIEATWVYEKDFDPKLVITNLEETRKETSWQTSRFDYESAITYVTLHWRIKGAFYENMELENFPRDVRASYSRVQKFR